MPNSKSWERPNETTPCAPSQDGNTFNNQSRSMASCVASPIRGEENWLGVQAAVPAAVTATDVDGKEGGLGLRAWTFSQSGEASRCAPATPFSQVASLPPFSRHCSSACARREVVARAHGLCTKKVALAGGGRAASPGWSVFPRMYPFRRDEGRGRSSPATARRPGGPSLSAYRGAPAGERGRRVMRKKKRAVPERHAAFWEA